jgi:Tfp pilus assembly protein PilF
MFTRLPRRTRVVVLLLSVFSCSARASASSNDVWIEVRSPNFTVVSNAGAKQTRQIANQFEQFRGVFHDSFPKLRVDIGKPLVIFAVRNEESMRTLLPAYWEVKNNKHPAGVYVRGLEKDFIVLRTDTQGENPYYVVYHEYTHAILDLNFRWLPIWLEEGIAEFFANSTIYENHVEIGKVSPYQIEILKKNRLIPVDDLLQADSKSPYYTEDNRATVFYAESCAIVHYLLLDSEARDQHLLQTFLDSWKTSGNQVDTARKAFRNLNTFSRTMQNYARQQRFYVADVKPSVHVDPKNYSSRELSPAEISALHGELYLYTNRTKEARAALDDALRADPKSPLVHEGLGLLAFRQRELGLAGTEFARAVELNSTSYIAYFFSARAQMGLTPGSDDGAREIADLERAIHLNPQFAPAYATLASVYSLNPTAYNEAIEAGSKAIELEPGNLSLAVSFGFALVNMGKTTEARSLASQIEAAARTPADREMVEKLNDRVAKGEEFAKRTAGSSSSVTVTPDIITHSPPDREAQNRLFTAVVQSGAAPKAKSSSLKISVKQEDGSVFRGAATVRVMPDEGHALVGARGDVAGEYVFMDVQSGRYVVEVSAPGYLAVRTKTEIEGRKQRILFIVMKPRVLAPEVQRETNGEIGASTNVSGAAAKVAATPKQREYWHPHELEEVVPPVAANVTCPTAEVLESTGQRMKEFVDALEKFTATETVEHYAFDPSGTRREPQARKYAYVAAVTLLNGQVFIIEEFRDGSVDPNQFPSRVATIGLPAIDLLFHPMLAGDFEFRCEGLGQWDGREVWQVHFAQRRDKPVRIRSYAVSGVVCPVFLEGRAWIDPGNSEVIHLESELAAPVPRIELTLEHMSIDYGPVEFQSTGERIWLPQVAELYVERHRKRYYRRHTFTDFKLFNVETAQSLRTPTGSYTITNISDRDVAGELSVVPSREGMGKAVMLQVTVPAHRSVVKVVGPGKDIDLAPESIGSATFLHDGTNLSVKLDVHLLQETTVDVVPAAAAAQKP